MSEMLSDRREAQKGLLDALTSATGLPTGLYEERDGRMATLFSDLSLDKFEPHCKFIQQFPRGKEVCDVDQCIRAKRVAITGTEDQTLCWAGLYNQAIPVIVDGVVKAVLLYGEMQIEGEEYRESSLQRHEQAVSRLKLSSAEAAELRKLLLQAKKYTPEELDLVKATFSRVSRFFYRMFEEEERFRQGVEQFRSSVEKITHEVQTRLQPVLANAENLLTEFHTLSEKEREAGVKEVLNSALALATMLNNWGQFQEADHFEEQPLETLLYEAKRIYAAEAQRRGISIRIDLRPVDGRPVVLPISRPHLQLALNNIVHNAIKYSFRSGPGRTRHIEITGRQFGRYYAVSVQNYGVGILPEEIESRSIFEDGVQGKLTQGEYRTGSGKGLYFAEQVIHRHYGRISVSSKQMSDEVESEGEPHLNEFTVLLPLERSKEEQSDA